MRSARAAAHHCKSLRYRDRLSGPLRDRLDLIVEVPALPVGVVSESGGGESSCVVRQRVAEARERQRTRYADDGIRTNAELTPALMTRYCGIGSKSRTLDGEGSFEDDAQRTRLRPHKKVARTIADLSGNDSMSVDHLAEALQFRMV